MQAVLDVNGCFSFSQPELVITDVNAGFDATSGAANKEFRMDLAFKTASYNGSLSGGELEKLKSVELQMQDDTREVEAMEVLQNDLETELYARRS